MTHCAGGRRSLIIVLLCYVVSTLGGLAPINFASPEPQPEYDLVILSGRVVDPESRLDAHRLCDQVLDRRR